MLRYSCADLGLSLQHFHFPVQHTQQTKLSLVYYPSGILHLLSWFSCHILLSRLNTLHVGSAQNSGFFLDISQLLVELFLQLMLFLA